MDRKEENNLQINMHFSQSDCQASSETSLLPGLGRATGQAQDSKKKKETFGKKSQLDGLQ